MGRRGKHDGPFVVNLLRPNLVAVGVVALAAKLRRSGAAVALILVVRAGSVIRAITVIGRAAVIGGTAIIRAVVIGVGIAGRGDCEAGADSTGNGRAGKGRAAATMPMAAARV